eukprot:CAMPEP_0176093268 /NCGR_PEP_ID=MMETSP0120_2-20121206/46734_1 /TAXON_ID=160619 /ORGANISM="Kryptoperidinium foliaceum, Strain CCMP 1326" /LENGTH=138 /DNA_ID=CAMNT_0017427201 /DNA_START=135 /DNA_END=549 /DNA_ORIENTATION=+
MTEAAAVTSVPPSHLSSDTSFFGLATQRQEWRQHLRSLCIGTPANALRTGSLPRSRKSPMRDVVHHNLPCSTCDAARSTPNTFAPSHLALPATPASPTPAAGISITLTAQFRCGTSCKPFNFNVGVKDAMMALLTQEW